MKSGDEPEGASSQPGLTLTDLLGTVIALISLVLPIAMISVYSSRPLMPQPPGYVTPLSKSPL